MVLHVHLVPRAGIGELLHEASDVGIAPVEEIDLEALDARFREMGRHALLVAVHLVERHPVPEIDAPLPRVLDEMIHVDNGTRLPDVEPEPDFVAVPVQYHVLKPVLRREIDEALVSLRVARLAAIESVPPVPRHLPRPHPRKIRVLVLRGRKRPHDVRLAELRRRIRKDEHAPRERTRPLRFHKPGLVLQHLDPRAPFLDALRRARELRLERRVRTRTEIPNRVVAHVGLRDGHVLPARLVRERQVEHHLRKVDLPRLGRERHRLFLAERPRPIAPALHVGGGKVQRRLLFIDPHLAGLLRLKAVRDAVVARDKPHAPHAEVDERLVRGKIDL